MASLREEFLQSVASPYVYNYPPTRLYRPIQVPTLTKECLTRRVNLYVHIPFCEQKCTFCGYLTVVDTSEKLRKRYVEALCHEIRLYAPLLSGCEIASVNFGGGTPSLLSAEEVGEILATIADINPQMFVSASEISIEATPETVTFEKFAAYRRLGINRVSLGVQTFATKEIQAVKRHNPPQVSYAAFEVLRSVGFPNICADLMYGLPGQDSKSFIRSVDALIALRPETVELYGTVVIPGTALDKRGGTLENEKIRSYESARERFLAAQYVQDCHLRFIIDGKGGYRQQAHVYALETLIGFGVGARSYTQRVHYRNVYDTAHSRDALRRYFSLVEKRCLPIEHGIALSDEELMRRYVIHQLERLDEKDFAQRFNVQLREIFPIITCLVAEGILIETKEKLVFDPLLLSQRDRVARELFSPAALAGEGTYYSHELVPLRRSR